MELDDPLQGMTSMKAKEVVDKLRKQNRIPPSVLFAVTNKRSIMIRSDLPHLSKWIKEQINTKFQEKDPNIVYQLLGRCADLLQIANVGCHNQACSPPMIKVTGKYQS